MNVCTYPNGVFAIRCDQTSNCPRTVSATQNIYFHGNSHRFNFQEAKFFWIKPFLNSFVCFLCVCVSTNHFVPIREKKNSPKKANGVWERERELDLYHYKCSFHSNMEKCLFQLRFLSPTLQRNIFRRKLRQLKIHAISVSFHAQNVTFYCNKALKLLVAFIRCDCVGIWLFFFEKISVKNLELGDDYSLTQLSTFWLNHFDNFMQSVNTSERKTRRKRRREKNILE